MKKSLLTGIICILFLPGWLFSQEKPVTLKGYVSSLQSALFDSVSGPFLNETLIHNRLNLKVYFTGKITFAMECRNRFFTGDMVRMGDAYASLTGDDPGFADLSLNLLKEESFLLNTTIDRLWLDFQFRKFQVTLGRQRINWGQTFVWNPNDIFNAYSFFEVDYPERPGSDAVRIQYFPTFSSAAEFALKINSDKQATAAFLYRFNLQGYDLQFLAGVVDGDEWVAGTGWSGTIGKMSFRGEGCWFVPPGDEPENKGILLMTAGLDKIFRDNSVAQVQFMYCNHPLVLSGFNTLYMQKLSARDLAYSSFTAFAQYSQVISPLMNLSLSAMWFPDLRGWFAGPSFECSLSENLGFSLIWQHFNARLEGEQSRLNMAFLRMKYDF